MTDDLIRDMGSLSRRRRADRALYKRLVISHFDLMDARRYLERLLGLNGESKPLAEDKIQNDALMTALVVAYGRSFSGNRTEEGVASTLPDRFVRGLTTQERRIHDYVIQLRNEEFAHSDPGASAVEIDVFQTLPGVPTAMPVSNRVRIGLGELELRTLSAIIARLYEQIYDEMRLLETLFVPGESF